MGVYRIVFDHSVDGGTVWFALNKESAMKNIREKLERYPYVKASLQVPKKSESGWKAHSSYEMRRNRKTGRIRLVKL